MGPWAISLLMITGFAGFAVLAWRKLAIVVALQPEVRWDRPGERIARLLTMGFGQSRMVAGEWKPGIMHAAIFLGFMALLVRKLNLIAIGYDPLALIPGWPGAVYAAIKELVEVGVLAALVYAFWRRFVLKPKRLEPNREAILILSLIAVIVVTDFLFDGFRFVKYAADAGITHERGFAPVGAALAVAFAGLSPGAIDLGLHASYWVQMVTVFTFLVLLPAGEHFHIVTALPAVFLARATPLNRVPSVDLERIMADDAGDDMKVGAKTAADLLWKEAFDPFTCTECGRCKDSCPTFLTGKPLAMKWVNDSLKHHLMEKREPIVAGKEADLPPLVGGVISEETLWACTTCGYCERSCPIGLEHLGRFYRLRQHQVMMEGAFPQELKAVFDAYESQSNPWGLPADTRGDWAKDLGVPLLENAQQAREIDWLFYVGSAQSFDLRAQKTAKAFVKILKAAGLRFAILGPREGSTGECVRRAGNEMLFQSLAQALVETLNGLGVARIVTCDPHAFNSLAHEYPEFGGKYEVIHHTQLIDRLIRDGKIAPRRVFEGVIYHEPCYLARHNGEYEAPRRVLAAVSRDTPPEFVMARDKAMCCGAGGGRMWMEEHTGKRINVLRAEQALERAPKAIVTACPYCAIMLRDGVAQLGHADDLPTRDIAELVAEAIEPAT
ncbi:MAG TPA: (Fe-S)-binding protein [Usitatibacteraceae bacterium]|nr:(Fe-S)-binding protein [Usitatibacteraceae bacterium]